MIDNPKPMISLENNPFHTDLKQEIIRIPLNEWDKVEKNWEEELNIKNPKKWKDKNKKILEYASQFVDLGFNFETLEVKTTSYVGTVQIGHILLNIRPKILDIKFMALLSYALDFAKLKTAHYSLYNPKEDGFLELLLIQLKNQVEHIIRHGLYRNYTELEENLTSPRGKINFRSYVREDYTKKAGIPCIYYRRLENNILNQILLAGLRLGAFKTQNYRIRYSLLDILKKIGENVDFIELTQNLLIKTQNQLSRLNKHYFSSLNLIKILNTPPKLAKNVVNIAKLPGFFFDMNFFFQNLLTHFFEDTLGKKNVKSESSIRNIYSFIPGFKPKKKKTPILRPDYIISDNSGKEVILDAKYRDLSEKNLHSKWLYQLSMYAISGANNPERFEHSIILYPTKNINARDVKILIKLPKFHENFVKSFVILRPVVWDVLYKYIINRSDPKIQKEAKDYAKALVFAEMIEIFYKNYKSIR